MKRRFQVRDYVCGRGRLLAEFLDATRQDLPESLVLREARRYCREHGAVLLIATGGPLKILPPSAARAGPQATGQGQAAGGPLSSTVLPSGSFM